jgi:hypothetical protein
VEVGWEVVHAGGRGMKAAQQPGDHRVGGEDGGEEGGGGEDTFWGV